MSLGEVLATFGVLMGIIGVPVGMLFRQHVKDDEEDHADHLLTVTELKTAHDLALAALKESHARELAACTREIADRDRRLEAANVTEARLIEMALRSTLAGEKAADTAVTALRGKA